MRVKLMNSAVMPAEGTYYNTKITKEQFVEILKSNINITDSYISYPQNIDYIYKISGIKVPLSRAETTLENGDVMLILKLKYRVELGTKGQQVNEDNFEYYMTKYIEIFTRI